jgi:arylsulfatase
MWCGLAGCRTTRSAALFPAITAAANPGRTAVSAALRPGWLWVQVRLVAACAGMALTTLRVAVTVHGLLLFTLLARFAAADAQPGAGGTAARPPDVLVILADDLGFSDVGAYGGEIATPHLDRLAAGGVRFTQGYSTSRCWPSRAALLTGFYAQSVNRDALPVGAGAAGGRPAASGAGGKAGSQGTRPPWGKLLPQRLAPAGYRAYHSGKWHVDGDPRGSGFARSLDVTGKGQSNFFDPTGITDDGQPITAGEGFYATTAIGDHAVACLDEHLRDHAASPFFHYVAFTAPHFPLQAPAERIAAVGARYRAGWNAIRKERQGRIAAAGIVTTAPAALEPAIGPPYPFPKALEALGPGETDRPLPWDSLTAEQRDFQAAKMAIHAAMVEAMDHEIGRIIARLEAAGRLANTLILFASDNGASAEIMVRGEGHDRAAPAGSRPTFLCLGPGWSSCANTPFRRHKTWVHEGGIASPWIVHWPARIGAGGGLRTQPVHLIDVTPTVLEAAGIPSQDAPPAAPGSTPAVPPLQGRSFLRALADPAAPPAHESLWWCHEGHRAVRVGDWKLVAAKGDPWELYDLATDRCETHDRAADEPERVAALARRWEEIAAECAALAAGPPAVAPSDKSPSAAAPPPAGAPRRPPNVVIVFADDLGYGDPGCYGGTRAPTPHIDRLAREGVRCTDFHVAQPVCSASRAALLTGCYPNRVSIAGALGPNARHGIAAAETTLAELLAGRGYATAAVGKWHLGHHPQFLPLRHGFGEYLGLPYSNDMWPHHPETKPGSYPPLPLIDGETVIDADVTPAEQAKLPARYAARAVDFIERAGRGEKPFFLYLAHAMPHVPLFAGEAFRGTTTGGLYGDVLAEIDASVGAVLAALERTGHADDTLVIFTSDNGPWLSYGDHGGSAGGLREGKGTVFEGGVRVPCVARLPGVLPAGRECAAPLMTIDILPTVAALTGAPLPSDEAGSCLLAGRRIDGHDRLASLCGRDDPAGTEPAYGFWYADNQLQAVRQGRWKLMLPHTARTMAGQEPGKGGTPGKYRPLPVAQMLFDLEADPAEERDVAAGHPAVVARLERLAEAYRAELGDSLTKRSGAGVRPHDTLPAADSPPAALSPPAARAARRPNIIYVMTDDQGYGDIAAHGNPVIRTPNLDRLHAGSVRFTEFHASPTCSPTRAALLTGRHEFRSGVTHTILERERLALSATTLPELLRAAGYATGIFGKWHLGDEAAYQPGKRGFERVFIHGAGGIGQTYPGSCGDAPGNRYFDPLIRSDGTFVKTTGYCTDVFFDAALAWIDDRRRTGEPFFCYLTPNAPHGPLDCPPGSDTPFLAALEQAGITDPAKRAAIAKFYGMIANIDTNVGRLLAALDEWGIADDTLVVFTTDNGTATGQSVWNAGMRGAKGSPWRGGTRVPSLWRWPKTLPAGVDVAAVTAHVDVLPTLCELAGVEIPTPVAGRLEGRSLVPLLFDGNAPWPDRPLVTHVGRWERGKAAESALRACRVREGRWSLVNVAGSAADWQLFDSVADPGETTDLSSREPALRERLIATYAAWWQSVQGDLVNEERDGPAENPFKTAFHRQFGADATATTVAAAAPSPTGATPPRQTAAQRRKAQAAAEAPPPTHADVPYGPHPKQVFHFWRPPGATAANPAPLLLFIHGGGWNAGDRLNGLAPMLPALLEKGIAVASVEYRFIKEAMDAGIEPPVRAPLHDAARALQTLRHRAAEFAIDPGRVVASGGSAGACTSLWLAFHDDLADPASADPVARQSTRLAGAAVTGAQTTLDPQQMRDWTPNSRYGGHAFGFMKSPQERDAQFAEFLAARDRILPWIAEYSPYALVTADDPPVALYYTAPPALGQEQKDPTHTANFGVKLRERLAAAGVPCELVHPGAADVRHPTVQAAIEALLLGAPAKR